MNKGETDRQTDRETKTERKKERERNGERNRDIQGKMEEGKWEEDGVRERKADGVEIRGVYIES